MGAFRIEIVGVGGHGCERKGKPGDKLYQRCGRFGCPDCMAFDFVQQMKQKGMIREGDSAYSIEIPETDPLVVEYRRQLDAYTASNPTEPFHTDLPVMRDDSTNRYFRQVRQSAEFTHWPEQPGAVVDDMLKNERKSGQF
jgi:hypothetical protein